MIARHDVERDANDLPGQRGIVVALWLDSRIRQQTRNHASLDSIMIALIREGRTIGFRLTIDGIAQIAARYLSANDRLLLRRYVSAGGPISLPQFALAQCVRIRKETSFQFELGMDEESVRRSFVVSGVKPDSEAFKAGLRDGQKITGVSVSWNDTSKPVRIRIRAADGDRTHQYYPRGAAKEIEQYYLDVGCVRHDPTNL